ncbi:hypothetical protein LSTR_LSTR010169 [Laodelphax striatellus]|uniref:Arrestin C-terminal-like domain-containing protein n=1 Tax=Laodelphax striatellus TaxID=195883 RepID=A0A482XKW3_LAOST|nr:hypothetical protein LSTR_LSTR010169 [Laodelphax striatellus]
MKEFVIEFDSPTNAYYAGQNVTGKLRLNLDKPKKVRSIQIKFLGKGEVKWTVQEDVRQNDGNTRSENVVYSGDEEYYTFKYNLAGGGNSELEIAAGEHVYPFSATLPPLLPSSFDGEHGHVRYTVTATLDRPWKVDQHATAIFTVVTPVDLNYNVKAKEPVKMEVEKSFCCCWCQSGPLQLVLAMPYSGFVPGQSMPLTLEVDNASNVRVDNVVVKLEKVLNWKARDPQTKTRTDHVELSKLALEGIEPNGSKSWTQLMPIPNLPPVNLDQSTIISCTYTLTAVAEVSGCHSNLSVEVPVFLGTVPIYQPPLAAAAGGDAPQPSAPEAPIGFNVADGTPANSLYPTITTPFLPQPDVTTAQ